MIGILPHFDGVVARWNCITVPKEGLIVHEVDRLIGTVLEVVLSADPVQRVHVLMPIVKKLSV